MGKTKQKGNAVMRKITELKEKQEIALGILLYLDEVCRKLAEEAGAERIVEEVPEGVEVTMRKQKDGTRYVFVQNFSRETVEVKLPIERYPVWQGTYDGTIGSWKTIVLKGR